MPKVKNSIVPYYNVREEDMPVKPGKQQETPVLASVAAPKAQRKQLEEPEFVDDSEVPPLE
jgi:hypothetical protein